MDIKDKKVCQRGCGAQTQMSWCKTHQERIINWLFAQVIALTKRRWHDTFGGNLIKFQCQSIFRKVMPFRSNQSGAFDCKNFK